MLIEMARSPQTRIALIAVAALIVCSAEVSLAELLPSKWAATYDKSSGRSLLDDTLPDPEAPAQSPAAIDFFGGRNGLQMLIGGHDFLDATPESTQIIIKVDDLANVWTFDALPNVVGLPIVSLADDDRTKALFVALGHGRLLHLDAASRSGQRDYELGLEYMSVAMEEWLRCVASAPKY